MNPEETREDRLDYYKNMEISLHRELMSSCRKYINELSIVSILGILDVVKQESIELEKATRHNIRDEEPQKIENTF